MTVAINVAQLEILSVILTIAASPGVNPSSSESEADPGVPFDQQSSDPEEMQENIGKFPDARPWAMLTSRPELQLDTK